LTANKAVKIFKIKHTTDISFLLWAFLQCLKHVFGDVPTHSSTSLSFCAGAAAVSLNWELS